MDLSSVFKNRKGDKTARQGKGKQSKACNDESKCSGGGHFKSFNFLSCKKIQNTKKDKARQAKAMPRKITMICQISRLLKLMSKYAHIEKSAVKNASVKVFSKSKYNFIFSINKIIASNYKFNLKGL